jgi:hypothetical protein
MTTVVRRFAAVVAGLLVAFTLTSSARAQGQAEGRNLDRAKAAKYTIALLAWDGPGHVKRAKEARDRLIRASGLKELYLIHGEDLSTLYYGYYPSISDEENPGEAARAKADMARLVGFRMEGGQPFGGAVFVAIPTPDPEAPPEWDLRNAKGVYSLEIGAFKDRPDRKEAAVEAVKEARGMGIEAYFYHGPTTSSVLVGVFGAEALTTIRPDTRVSPDKEIIIVPFKPKDLPESGEIQQADGTKAQVLEFRVEVTDMQLRSLMKQFPEHAVNGAVAVRRITDPKTGRVTEKLAESFIVDISQIQRDSLLAAGSGVVRPRDEMKMPPPDVMVPRRSTPGGGSLKGIQ